MLKATIDDLLRWKPCYEDEKIIALAGDVTEFTALDVLKRDDIPVKDRLWVVLRPELIDNKTRFLFACYAARSVLEIYEREHPGDDRVRNAINVAERYANGNATDDELAAARDAAWDAAWDARDNDFIKWLIEYLENA